jgi:hypothetical protein
LEAGTASGREPTTTVPLTSYLAQFFKESGVTFNAEDEQPFPMRLLHFRRTFVEKMFAIHATVEMFKRDGRPIGIRPTLLRERHLNCIFIFSNVVEMMG